MVNGGILRALCLQLTQDLASLLCTKVLLVMLKAKSVYGNRNDNLMLAVTRYWESNRTGVMFTFWKVYILNMDMDPNEQIAIVENCVGGARNSMQNLSESFKIL